MNTRKIKNKNQAKVIQENVVLCKTNFAMNKTKICKNIFKKNHNLFLCNPHLHTIYLHISRT